MPVLVCRMPWEDPATAFRSASTFIPPEIVAKRAAAAIAEAEALTDEAQVQTQLHQCGSLSWRYNKCHCAQEEAVCGSGNSSKRVCMQLLNLVCILHACTVGHFVVLAAPRLGQVSS